MFHNAPSTYSQGTSCEGGFERLWIRLISHAPYSPELAPSDFHLFPNLKGHSRGKHFKDDNGLKTATKEWSHGRDKTRYLNGIEKLRENYNKCIAVQGDYVEK